MSNSKVIEWDGLTPKQIQVVAVEASKTGGSVFFTFELPINYTRQGSHLPALYTRAQLLNRDLPEGAKPLELDPSKIAVRLVPQQQVISDEIRIQIEQVLWASDARPIYQRDRESSKQVNIEPDQILLQARQHAELIRDEARRDREFASELKESTRVKEEAATRALVEAEEQSAEARRLKQDANDALAAAHINAKEIIDEAKRKALEVEVNAAAERARGRELISNLERHLYHQTGGTYTRIDLWAQTPPTEFDNFVAPGLANLLAEADRCNSHQTPTVLERSGLALILASATGQLPIFAGPPGSGKTTLAVWMSQFMGYEPRKIPVRPGWIDSSDLLGYFDPRLHRFIPERFTECLIDSLMLVDRGMAIILDEMNIARIENYAADLLSQLEKTHESLEMPRIDLYSRFVEISSWKPEDERTPPTQQSPLRSIPPSLGIPRTLMVLGTINHDRTTFDLSPKVLDRSLVVKVDHNDTYSLSQKVESPTHSFRLGPGTQETLETDVARYKDEAERLWNSLKEISGPEIGIRPFQPSQRTAQLVRLLPAAARLLGLSNTRALDHLLCMKALPLINGFRESPGHSSDELLGAAEIAAELDLQMLEMALRDLAEAGTDMVSYLR